MHPYRTPGKSSTEYTPSELAWFRKPLLALALFAGCVRNPHIDPATRTHETRDAAVVSVDVVCGDIGKRGTGVLLSERYVLTAAHVVACAQLPNVHVQYKMPNGEERILKMVVEQEDMHYGKGLDIARLEIASAENFGVGVVPPLLAERWPSDIQYPASWCTYLRDQVLCGQGSYLHMTLDVQAHPGDSGAAVYDERGRLVGLLVRGDDVGIDVVPVDLRWLSGT